LNPWDLIIQEPVINALIVMSHYMAGNFGMAIIALTIIINLLMLQLTLKQVRSTKAMQDLQPRLAELQQKYGKDRQKMAQEQMRLYKESGVKPAGCAITMIIQFPVWIALYRSIMLSLAAAPEGLLNLSKYLYSWPMLYAALPLSQDFMGMNLADPNFILAILVGATMWLQQKMSMTTPTDPKQRSQSQMMLWMMPLLFAFLALSFPSGLSLYWAATSIVRIVIQYRVTGWGGITREAGKEAGKDKKYVRFIDQAEGKTTDDAGADIVMTSEEQHPSKMRYLPGKDRVSKRGHYSDGDV